MYGGVCIWVHVHHEVAAQSQCYVCVWMTGVLVVERYWAMLLLFFCVWERCVDVK